MTGWQVERESGPAEALFGSSVDLLPHIKHPTARILVPDAPVLVLGSAQRADVVGPGVAWTKRRSGGGAVWLDPAQQVWVDVLLPRCDDKWTDDVRESFTWLGEAWSAALAGLGVPAASTTIHRGAPVATRWSSLLCFAGRGPGEVLIGHRKVIGVAQRRTRHGALFQCGALLDWHFDPMVFAPSQWPGVPDGEVMETGVGLHSILGRALTAADVERALTDALVSAS